MQLEDQDLIQEGEIEAKAEDEAGVEDHVQDLTEMTVGEEVEVIEEEVEVEAIEEEVTADVEVTVEVVVGEEEV